LGRIRDLKYRVRIVRYDDLKGKSASNGEVLGALAKALNIGVNGVFNMSQEMKLSKKLNEMYPQIYDAMKDHTGVLVVVRYQQWKTPDAAGNNPLQLLSVMLGPSASNFQSAFRQWQNQPKLMQGPDKGMVYGPIACYWFTRYLSFEELKSELNKPREKEYWKPAY
jgi:hypothetical protein